MALFSAWVKVLLRLSPNTYFPAHFVDIDKSHIGVLEFVSTYKTGCTAEETVFFAQMGYLKYRDIFVCLCFPHTFTFLR